MLLTKWQNAPVVRVQPRVNNSLKTRGTSILRPRLRACYAFLIAIAVLWTMPGNARAQRLYVPVSGTSVLRLYNASTGELINPDFITVTGVGIFGLLVDESEQHLFLVNAGANTVSKYDASAGAPINTRFITGLAGPNFLALSGHKLFVSLLHGRKISVYDARTGDVINANLITGVQGALAVKDPTPFSPDGFLFVADSDRVGKYNATTGAVINASFIQGLDGAIGLALSGDVLFVVNFASGTIGVYDANNGAMK